jgi:hypothetical protein
MIGLYIEIFLRVSIAYISSVKFLVNLVSAKVLAPKETHRCGSTILSYPIFPYKASKHHRRFIKMSSPLSPEEKKRRLGILIRRRRQIVSSDEEEEEDGENQWKEEELSINSKKPRVDVSNNDDASLPSMNEPPLDPLVRAPRCN